MNLVGRVWVCDKCRTYLHGESAARFRCIAGCDFDLCHDCFPKDATKGIVVDALSHAAESFSAASQVENYLYGSWIFTGSINKLGKPEGKGSYVTGSGEKFSGYFTHGKRTGQGTLEAPDQVKYEGSFDGNHFQGKVLITSPHYKRLALYDKGVETPVKFGMLHCDYRLHCLQLSLDASELTQYEELLGLFLLSSKP
jgi:hypothetical protein